MMHYVFREVVWRLWMESCLTVDQFAKKSGIDRETVIAMEREVGFRPTPLMIHRLRNDKDREDFLDRLSTLLPKT
jgi:hypothetical protein